MFLNNTFCSAATFFARVQTSKSLRLAGADEIKVHRNERPKLLLELRLIK